MPNPYQGLFTVPGTRGLVAAGLLSRLALPMTGIGFITMLSQLQASYTLSGAVAATFILTYALLSPQISRLVDRYGQGRVLPPAALVSGFGVILTLAASWWHMPDWTLFPGAVLAGFMPSLSAMVRARWTALYRGTPRLQTAYSLEAVLDEVTFIAGPPLSVGLCVALFPQAGPLVAAFLLVLGVFALVLQRGTEPPLQPQNATETTEQAAGKTAGQGATAGATGSLLWHPSIQLLSLLMVAMGIIVGTVDIVSVAFAEQHGQPAAASLILSTYAAGSCAAGLVFGALKLQTPLHRLLLVGGVATAITTIPLLLVDSLVGLAGAVLMAGLFFAPTMIVALSLVERRVPAHRLTEGMTWLLAGLNVGAAVGAAVSGQRVDDGGPQAGFAVALWAGAAVLAVALLGSSRLRDTPAPEDPAR